MKVISDKEVRVATLTGAVVLFQAGVEREVSDEIGLIALQMGAKEVQAAAPTIEEEVAVSDEPVVVIEEEVAAPDSDLVAVMEGLIDEGDPENFKADGTPKAAVVNKAAGRTVSTSEREVAWQEALNT
jgi:hypothetical protein